jgi:dipeptidyl aminopeptidase/acylaminoacyl peptidase
VGRVSRSRVAVIVLVGLSFVGSVAFAGGDARAQSSAWGSTNGLLAFRSDRDGEPDVFTLDVGSGAAVKLKATPGAAELQPAWSPEGDRIAFVRRAGITGRADLFVMNAGGTGRTRLTSTPVSERDPSWAPNGTRIVYSARTAPGLPFRIFVAKADGKGRVQLTFQKAGSADRSPVWSPDGTRIAFVSNRDGGFPELYLMNADGTGVHRLTTNALIDANPSWSPDGTKLVFERCCESGTFDLLTIDLATRTTQNLTASTTRQEFDPSWSPDGTKIAFAAFEIGQGDIDIWVASADGSNPVRLTQQTGPDLSPDWQPIPVCTINGTSLADELTGTDGNDVICALDGNDHVTALAGDDLVLGGKGDDVIEGQDGDDLLFGGPGDDTLLGAAGYDVLDGGAGTDTCIRGADGALHRLCEL